MQNCGPTGSAFKRNLSVAPDHREQAARACQEQLHTPHSVNNAVPGFVRIDLMKYYKNVLKNVLRTFSASNREKNKNAQPQPQN